MSNDLLKLASNTASTPVLGTCTSWSTKSSKPGEEKHIRTYSKQLHGLRISPPGDGLLSPRAWTPGRYLKSPQAGLGFGAMSPLSPKEHSTLLPYSPALLTPFLVQDAPRGPSESTKLGTFSAIMMILGKTIGVGIFSVPSSILSDVGSVGMALLLWLIGALISFCGLAVYLDLGTALPVSGGDKVYLERIFRKPKLLASCAFMSYIVLLGFSTPNCIVLGEYLMYALDIEENWWNVRLIAIFALTLTCLVHARSPRLGLTLVNVLGVVKIIMILFIIFAGFYSALAGVGLSETDGSTTFSRNFTSAFAASSLEPYTYATALLKVIYCFRGYNTINQVLSEVRNPVKTLRTAAPVTLSIVSGAYLLTNLAYLCAVEKSEIASSGVVVAGHFFRNVFGWWGEHILPVLIVLSALGSIAATSFAQSRVNQELAREDLMPFSRFWRSTWPWGSPGTALFLHWIVSLAVILLPPGEVYSFLVTLGAYPVSILSIAISAGLIYLQRTPKEHWASPAPAPTVAIAVFLVANLFLAVVPWIPPVENEGVARGLPYYAYPAGGLAILVLGVVYWVWWNKVRNSWVGLERQIVRDARQEDGSEVGLLACS